MDREIRKWLLPGQWRIAYLEKLRPGGENDDYENDGDVVDDDDDDDDDGDDGNNNNDGDEMIVTGNDGKFNESLDDDDELK